MEAPITAKAALLQVLIAGPGYGLELIERVSAHTRGALVLGQGSVYPALRELEREGLVKSYQEDGPDERGGRPRVYYKITADGRRAAVAQRATILGLFEATGARS